MNFELTEDQRMIVEAAAGFAKRSPVARMRGLRDDAVGWSPEVWRQMAQLGWLGLALPEGVGGSGGTIVDAALLVEQLGMVLAPEPIVTSLVAAHAILAAGNKAQRDAFVAPFVEGRASLALAWAEGPQLRYDRACRAVAVQGDGGWRITGEKRFVLEGHTATHLVVTARLAGVEDSVALFVVDPGMPGVTVRPLRTIDGRRAAHVKLDVVVPEDRRLRGDGKPALDLALDLGAALACAEGVGIMRTVLAMTVEYLRTREQFGVKIGSFQALQHRAVDMFVETELARSLATAAAIRVDGDDATERRLAVSAAKVQLHESGRFVTQQAIQLHGGIGITDEHDVGLFFKRMVALNAIYGDADYHVARFAEGG
ncbi:MAG: acyl-CoA dehydrogenase family protein [Deltaproteobacteria bacterium]|nr:acyl-CoA dehydrogenase family protein [Deltaproteobacteria bacterium]